MKRLPRKGLCARVSFRVSRILLPCATFKLVKEVFKYTQVEVSSLSVAMVAMCMSTFLPLLTGTPPSPGALQVLDSSDFPLLSLWLLLLPGSLGERKKPSSFPCRELIGNFQTALSCAW